MQDQRTREQTARDGAAALGTQTRVAPSSSRMLTGYMSYIEQLLDERQWEAALREALDLPQIAEIWRYGSVVRSWLLDLTASALEKNPTLAGLEAYVEDSGEGRWTVMEAIDLNISAPVITESLIRRLRSREENNFTDRMLSVMRNEFGGHAVKKL